MSVGSGCHRLTGGRGRGEGTSSFLSFSHTALSVCIWCPPLGFRYLETRLGNPGGKTGNPLLVQRDFTFWPLSPALLSPLTCQSPQIPVPCSCPGSTATVQAVGEPGWGMLTPQSRSQNLISMHFKTCLWWLSLGEKGG